MQHRVLILGKRGMLGHMVEHVLAADARFAVRGVGRAEFDATAPTPGVISSGASRSERSREISRVLQLDALLADVDYAINCIGITARHIDDADPASVARAVAVNAAFPHALAAAAAEHGVRVIHVSTDGVFSGNRAESYTEGDPPDATDTYGRTKILGESSAANALNIRCSIVGSSPIKREGLWEWVVAQPDGATVQGYTNHMWHGVTTRQFAKFCARVIRDDLFVQLRANGHVLHYAPNTPCSKYALLCAIRDALGKRLTIEPTAHMQSISRTLAMRSDLVALVGASHPIAESLRACAAVTA